MTAKRVYQVRGLIVIPNDKEGFTYREKTAPHPIMRGRPITAEYKPRPPVLTRMRVEIYSDPREQSGAPAAVDPQKRPARAPGQRKRQKVTGRREPVAIDAFEDGPSTYPGPDTLARTKRLILAAIKVWELKNGIRHD